MIRTASEVIGEGSDVSRSETREEGKSKDKCFGQNLDSRDNTIGQLPQEAIKKIDRDKVKAALEKRRKSRVDFIRKTDSMDEDELIEREIEGGIELAAENEKNKQDRRQSWLKSSGRHGYENLHHGKHLKDAKNRNHHKMRGQSSPRQRIENVGEAELSVPDDSGRNFRSPKSSNRKRKGESPAEKLAEGRQRNDYGPGFHHYKHHQYVEIQSKVGWHGYNKRDQKGRARKSCMKAFIDVAGTLEWFSLNNVSGGDFIAMDMIGALPSVHGDKQYINCYLI
ncbi:hypothetical protein CFOL_v3_07641 [Cephalotus follicularis]|uniref:Uncharacterized protein n=1 Tax=Cephalotus follicularis TaxID=3775 RepID=A0A1Q3B8M4_CEPFO|nr:hypothetical protein CFOL_v3_07641 [Cephalotus follicularis]